MKSLAQQDPRANKWENQGIKAVIPRPIFLMVFVSEKSNWGWVRWEALWGGVKTESTVLEQQ